MELFIKIVEIVATLIPIGIIIVFGKSAFKANRKYWDEYKKLYKKDK